MPWCCPRRAWLKCEQVAQKVRQQLVGASYVEGQERLTFSIGAAVVSSEELAHASMDAGAMLRQADAAMNRAKLSGGASVEVPQRQ